MNSSGEISSKHKKEEEKVKLAFQTKHPVCLFDLPKTVLKGPVRIAEESDSMKQHAPRCTGLRLVDDDGSDAAVGEVGEIVFLVHYKNDETTGEAYFDGWIHTGERAVEDENGFFWIEG